MPTPSQKEEPMAKETKRRPTRVRQVQTPKQRGAPPRGPWLLYALGATALVGIAVAVALITTRGGSPTPRKASAGLPNTPDYHSLLVSPGNPRKLVLGTHYGLYVSSDGVRH